MAETILLVDRNPLPVCSHREMTNMKPSYDYIHADTVGSRKRNSFREYIARSNTQQHKRERYLHIPWANGIQ